VIGRGFSFRLGAQAISALINVAGVVLLGGYLAAEGYGQYAFYYALVPLVATLSDLGIGVIVTREVARDRALGARYLGDALIVKGAVSAVLLLAVALTAPRLLEPAPALLMILVTAAGLLDISQDVGVWLFRANDRQDLRGSCCSSGRPCGSPGSGCARPSISRWPTPSARRPWASRSAP
jgi:O-antigen/teichoic acid export membrane protein